MGRICSRRSSGPRFHQERPDFPWCPRAVRAASLSSRSVSSWLSWCHDVRRLSCTLTFGLQCSEAPRVTSRSSRLFLAPRPASASLLRRAARAPCRSGLAAFEQPLGQADAVVMPSARGSRRCWWRRRPSDHVPLGAPASSSSRNRSNGRVVSQSAFAGIGSPLTISVTGVFRPSARGPVGRLTPRRARNAEQMSGTSGRDIGRKARPPPRR